MSEIIIIRGYQNSGKTTTAGLVYQELLTICDKIHKFNDKDVFMDSLLYNDKGETKDFTAILTFGKTTVGIKSDGDDAKNVKKGIEDFIELKIDIIICCARSRNVTGSVIRMIIDEFSDTNPIVLNKFTNYSINKDEKYKIKKETVGIIINKVKELSKK